MNNIDTVSLFFERAGFIVACVFLMFFSRSIDTGATIFFFYYILVGTSLLLDLEWWGLLIISAILGGSGYAFQHFISVSPQIRYEPLVSHLPTAIFSGVILGIISLPYFL